MTGKESASDAQKSADAAKDAADKAQQKADDAKEKASKSGDKSDKDAADKAQKDADKAKDAAGRSQDAADDAKDAADKGDDETAKKKAKEARDAAKEAQDAAGNGERKEGEGKEDKGKEGERKEGESQSKEASDEHGTEKGDDNTEELSEADLKEIKERAEKYIEKARNRIAGDFGTFIKKCRASVEMKKEGLQVKVSKGNGAWNKVLHLDCHAYVKKKVFQKKRELEYTWKRINRRQGFVEWGKPIMKGRRPKQDKLNINVAFFIDRSGSMQNCINDVFNASYSICDSLKKSFGKDKIVGDVDFKMHAFDYSMHPLKYGQKMTAFGGTMPFAEVFKYIEQNTNDYLINIIITDGESEVNRNSIKDLMKTINGMVAFVCNSEKPEVKKLSEEQDMKTKLFYIKADSNFTIDNNISN